MTGNKHSDSGSIGVILGRFLPPHRGHEYLARFASQIVDKLWIFVSSLPGDPIPGSLRAAWMRELFPDACIVHIEEVNPAANRHQPGAVRIWAEAVLRHTGSAPDFVFASEDYGWSFAEALGARFIPVDPSRDQFPISGTELRAHPFRHWHYLPAAVRTHFVRDLTIRVPESHLSLAEDIIRTAALLLNTLYVPLYERFYRQFDTGDAHPLDPGTAAAAQLALTRALRSQARCFLLRCAAPDMPHDDEAQENLELRLEFNYDASWGSLVSAAPSSPDIPGILNLRCTPETAAHAIRDAAIDRYKAWF